MFKFTKQCLALLVVLGLSGCINGKRVGVDGIEQAVFHLPESEVSLVIERRPMHAFLAEYYKTIILHGGAKEISRMEIFPDTGGKSRTNLYKLSGHQYTIRSFNDVYLFDAQRLDLKEMKDTDFKGRFIGSFDQDLSQKWRFISVSERREMKIEKQ